MNIITGTEAPIHLGKNSSNECAGGLICSNCPPFQETIIDATGRDETFVAHIGPPANPRGYMAIAGECLSKVRCVAQSVRG